MKMKRIFRRNQIIITALAVMIAAAGYLSYAGGDRETGAEMMQEGELQLSEEDIFSENQAAAGLPEEEGEFTEIASLEDPSEGEEAGEYPEGNPGEAVLTGGTTVTEYIADIQLSREQIRAKSRETLNGIINNEDVDEGSRQAAVQTMMTLAETAEKENAAETLLMARGFANPVVSITDGKADVVINAVSVTEPQRAQIEDIVKRKTGLGAENIVITLMNLEE